MDKCIDKRFYHTGAWTRLRLQALARDHWLCQHCLAQGRFTCASEVHHLTPVEDDPTLALTLENLVSLCRPCHEATKRHGAGPATLPAGVRVLRP